MAQGDIIQKDLGLVTAYGYALAGGYQGTEEQFKIDFANLMAGKYSGSELKEYSVALLNPYAEDGTFVTLDTEPFIAFRNGDFCGSSLISYGNMSTLFLNIRLGSDLAVSSPAYLCELNIVNNTIDIDLMMKYIPYHNAVPIVSGGSATNLVGSIAFDDYGLDSETKQIYQTIKPAVASVVNFNKYSKTFSSLYVRFGVEFIDYYLSSSSDSILIPSGTVLTMQYQFMSYAGMFKGYTY